MPMTRAFADEVARRLRFINDDPFTPPTVQYGAEDVTDAFWPEWFESGGWRLTALREVVANTIGTRAGSFPIGSTYSPELFTPGMTLTIHVGTS